MKLKMWEVKWGILSSVTVIAKNAKEAIEKGIVEAKRQGIGEGLENITGVELIAEES